MFPVHTFLFRMLTENCHCICMCSSEPSFETVSGMQPRRTSLNLLPYFASVWRRIAEFRTADGMCHCRKYVDCNFVILQGKGAPRIFQLGRGTVDPEDTNNLFNPLKPELNPICSLLALLGAHHFLHVSRIRVKLLNFMRLMSYIYGAPILDVSRSHTTTQHSR